MAVCVHVHVLCIYVKRVYYIVFVLSSRILTNPNLKLTSLKVFYQFPYCVTRFVLLSAIVFYVSAASMMLNNLSHYQKIALRWMMIKETEGVNCLGGILADDQVSLSG